MYKYNSNLNRPWHSSRATSKPVFEIIDPFEVGSDALKVIQDRAYLSDDAEVEAQKVQWYERSSGGRRVDLCTAYIVSVYENQVANKFLVYGNDVFDLAPFHRDAMH